MLNKVFFHTLLLSLIVLNISGCAMLLVDDRPPPNMSALHAGMPRADIEKELGKPYSEMRPEKRTGAVKKCEYQFLVRDPVKQERTWSEKLSDAMTGFRQVLVTVYYDQNGIAKAIQQREARNSSKKL